MSLTYVYVSFMQLIFNNFQRNSDRSAIKVFETASSPSAFEDHQSNSEAEGRLRLRRHLAQERFQHSHRLHSFSGEKHTLTRNSEFKYLFVDVF